MGIDFDKEEQKFREELNEGKFKIERVSNTSPDYRDFEERDLNGFNNYIKSDSFKTLDVSSKAFCSTI